MCVCVWPAPLQRKPRQERDSKSDIAHSDRERCSNYVLRAKGRLKLPDADAVELCKGCFPRALAMNHLALILLSLGD
eukprot:3905465-Amphidinium_carterae.1